MIVLAIHWYNKVDTGKTRTSCKFVWNQDIHQVWANSNLSGFSSPDFIAFNGFSTAVRNWISWSWKEPKALVRTSVKEWIMIIV